MGCLTADGFHWMVKGMAHGVVFNLQAYINCREGMIFIKRIYSHLYELSCLLLLLL
jgi:hypothetical protein